MRKRRVLMNVWDVFWFLFLFIPLCILWVIVLVDVIGRRDLVGWHKAIWVMVIIFFPWIGVFAYLIVRPRSMTLPSYAGAAAPGSAAAPSAGSAYTPPAAQPSPTAVPAQVSQVQPVPGDARGATT